MKKKIYLSMHLKKVNIIKTLIIIPCMTGIMVFFFELISNLLGFMFQGVFIGIIVSLIIIPLQLIKAKKEILYNWRKKSQSPRTKRKSINYNN
jgi:uncharacterized membrane protein YgaE (UPF0421/DUF939 family)